MCNSNKSDESSCISEILKVISILQKNASCCGETCLDTCDRGFLGCNSSSISCNTRPIMLYTCGGNGTAFAMPISKDSNETDTSKVFRVEKVDDNCATFRVLVQNTDTSETGNTYVATNSFFTMDLNCCCAIRCLNDTFVECI
jgi:hypothetical protein